MGFAYLMDTHKMTLFKKEKRKTSKLERSKWNKCQYHEVPTVSYPSVFVFRLDRTCFFQPNNLEKMLCTGEKKFAL